MFKDLFAIFIRPQQTLDNVLFDKNTRRSWKATWTLILATTITSLLALVIIMLQKSVVADLISDKDGLSLGIFWVLLMVFWLFFSALYAGVMVLQRILFPWFVRMGLRISAGDQYPTDPEERREKGKLLQLIHPYTTAIQAWPGLILSLAIACFAGYMIGELPGLDADAQVGMNAGQLIIFILLYVVSIIVSIGCYVYLIIARVIAIKKIYNISGARAFWGPFLIYFLFTVIPYIFLVIFMVIIGIVTSSTTTTM